MSSFEMLDGLLTGHTLYPSDANFFVIAEPVASPAPIITAENFDKSFIKVLNYFIPLYKIVGKNESRLYL
jgi:hypothetical protein